MLLKTYIYLIHLNSGSKSVTACCFGGEDLTDLYVSTAKLFDPVKNKLKLYRHILKFHKCTVDLTSSIF